MFSVLNVVTPDISPSENYPTRMFMVYVEHVCFTNDRYCDVYAAHPNDCIECLLQEATYYLANSEKCGYHKDFVSALSYCSDASSK